MYNDPPKIKYKLFFSLSSSDVEYEEEKEEKAEEEDSEDEG